MQKRFKEDTDEEKPIFPEDTSDTESEEGDTTLSFVQKATTKRRKKIKALQVSKFCVCNSQEDAFLISSDSELETSMVEIEASISLEFSDSE